MKPIYRFGLFEVNPASRELLRQGTRIRIQEQPFRLLLLLLENQTRLVTREELRQQLWAEDTYVDFDSSLRVAVRKLRDALGDDADNPRFVATVPRRGYRFLAPVTTTDAVVPPTSRSPAISETADTAISPPASESPALQKPRRWRIWRGVSAVAALLLLSLVVSRYYHHAGPAYALGNTDTVLLADFLNKTGDVAFDDTLKQALSISLSQSPFLNMVPDHRVAETLKLMGRSPDERITGETALEVCRRTGSKAALAGSIASFGSQYVISLDATNCLTGAVFVQEQIQASRKEEVLKSLGEISTQLRQKLGESLSSIQKFDIPLEQTTTSSLDALRAYSKGVKIRNVNGPAESIPYLKHAIELDANFASAYGVLGTSYLMLGEDGLGSEVAKKAYDLRGRVTERENFAITSYYYNFVLGDRTKALQNCRLWADSYPRDLAAHICLFFDTEMIGRYEAALPEGLRCIEVDPEAGACYADLISTYAALNRLEDAKAIYAKAISHKLDNPDLHTDRYGVAFLEGDEGEMARQIAWATGKPGSEYQLLVAQSDTEAFHGRLAKARELSHRAVESALRSDQKESAARVLVRSALREAMVGNSLLARQQVKTGLGIASFEYLQGVAAVTEALAGDSGLAEKIGNTLDRANPSDTMLHAFWLPSIQASTEINHDRPARAIDVLQRAASCEMGEHIPLLPAFLRGQAYLATRQGLKAAVEFQKVIDHRGLIQNSTLGALAYLGLGRAYALQLQSSRGDDPEVARAKARVAYQAFLTLWKDADQDIPILKQAKQEYEKLK
jgi:DNA-binding winged helix-turn-helix (wHTH) protein/tetratricopeptide (TPR) repeat protein